ncbi:MAG: GNAT family N-acetyltransferase [Halanaerobiales bacterium]|nr:GNAT family N-acetyltransferase [Halanaerobiales bacterium]
MDKKFEHEIKEYWANRYNCNPEDIAQGRTIVNSIDHLEGSKKVYISYLDDCSLVAVDPLYLNKVKSLIEESSISRAILVGDLKEFFGKDNVFIFTPGYVTYLIPENFSLGTLDKKFNIRQLDKKDNQYLEILNGACTKRELEYAFVEIDHPVIFGCFYEDQLVAVASFIFWGDHIVDIGVLTHPEYRGKGLGKTVVGALCKWGIDNDKILQYRFEITNIGSGKIAESLGFTKYIKEEEVEILVL